MSDLFRNGFLKKSCVFLCLRKKKNYILYFLIRSIHSRVSHSKKTKKNYMGTLFSKLFSKLVEYFDLPSYTSLHLASAKGDIEYVKALLEAGAHANTKDYCVCQEESVW
jgi:ankyrin repeat protein